MTMIVREAKLLVIISLGIVHWDPKDYGA